MLQHTKGYAYGKNRRQQHTHNFFVDDLKLYSTNLNNIKNQIDTLTTFSKDFGMAFSINKCAYLHIEKGKFDKSEPLTIKNSPFNQWLQVIIIDIWELRKTSNTTHP